MLLEQVLPPFFKTNSKVKKLIKKHGFPSDEVLKALRGKEKKCGVEYDVVKKAKV